MSSNLDNPHVAPPTEPSDVTVERPSGRSMVLHSVLLYTGLLVVAVVWGLLDGLRNIYVAPGSTSLWRSGLGAAAGLGLGLMVVAFSRISVELFRWARQLHQEFHELLAGLTTGQTFVLAVASAVGEEALFRGAMVPTMGIWWSSALFALAHFPVRRQLWPWPLMAFVMGLAFAGLYRHFGDLSGPIVAHATINFLNLGHIARQSYPAGPKT